MSDEKKKPTQTREEKLARVLAQAEADEAIERFEKMSDDEIAKELADAGVDVQAAERKMAALLAKHGVDVDAPAKPAGVVPIAAAKRRRSPTEWTVMGLAAALVLGIAWQLAKRGAEEDVPVASPLDAGEPDAAATDAPAPARSAP